MVILQGCKELVRLGFRECVGFEVDDEILKLASHIRTFEYECSRAKSVPPDDDGEFVKMCLVGLINYPNTHLHGNLLCIFLNDTGQKF